VPAGRLVCVATTPQLMMLATELKCSMNSPWSSWEDHRRRRPLWEWSGDRQQTDVIWQVPYVQHSSPKALRGDLTSTVSWARRHRHSKVLVMIEDEQRSLGALKPVAAILYLPDADAVWFCFVPHH
jgi:hypothetical protein